MKTPNTYKELKEYVRKLNTEVLTIWDDEKTILLALPKPKNTTFWYGKWLGFDEDGTISLIESNMLHDKSVIILATNKSCSTMWTMIKCLAFNEKGV